MTQREINVGFTGSGIFLQLVRKKVNSCQTLSPAVKGLEDVLLGAGPASLPAHLEGRETRAPSSGASRFNRNQWPTGKTRAPASDAGPALWIPGQAPFGGGG